MAVTAVSYGQNTSNNPTDVPKPTGLAAGDLMICQLMTVDVTVVSTWSTGWTLINKTTQSTNLFSELRWKIASSGDAAGANVTISTGYNVSSTSMASITRVTGMSELGVIASAGSGSASGTPTYGFSISPGTGNENALYLFYTASQYDNVAGYHIDNDNPSWTELYDTLVPGSKAFSMAYGNRTTITGTGSGNVTIGAGGSIASVGQMVVIRPARSVSASDIVTSTESVFVYSSLLHHFIVEKVGGGSIPAQKIGVPFNIQVTAKDEGGNTRLAYTGQVAVTSSTATITSGGGVTPSFVAGVLASRSITISPLAPAATIMVTDNPGSATGISNAFIVYGITDIEPHVGNIYYPVKIIPTLSNVKHINIICAPNKDVSGTQKEAAIKFYFNQSPTPYMTKYVTRDDINKGYVSIEINKPYSNSIQIEVEYYNSGNLNPDGLSSNLGEADFSPSYAELYYEPTSTIR